MNQTIKNTLSIWLNVREKSTGMEQEGCGMKWSWYIPGISSEKLKTTTYKTLFAFQAEIWTSDLSLGITALEARNDVTIYPNMHAINFKF
jgi:hypothetical protein